VWKFLCPEPPPPDPAASEAPPAKLITGHRCRRCRHLYSRDEEGAILRRGWCYSCESRWLEDRIYGLIGRIGRKAALIAIRRLLK
jgi:hypothetical protein